MNKKILTLTLAASVFGMTFAAPGDKPESDTIKYFKLLYNTVVTCGIAKENPEFNGTGDYTHKANFEQGCDRLKKELDAASSDPQERAALQNLMHDLDPRTFPKIQLEASSPGFIKSTLSKSAASVIAGAVVPLVIGYVHNNRAGAAGAGQ